MGMSEHGIYPPAEHFHWEYDEIDENIIGIGGTIFSDKFTYLFTCCFPVVKVGNILELFGAAIFQI